MSWPMSALLAMTNAPCGRTKTRLNVGIVEDVDTTRKIVGSRRTPKVVRRENTDPGVQKHTS